MAKRKKIIPPKKAAKSGRFGKTAGGGQTELDTAASARDGGGRRPKPNRNRG